MTTSTAPVTDEWRKICSTVQGSTTPTDRVVPEHRRPQRPTVTEFNPTIKCFLSAQIHVMPDPSGVSVPLDVERQPFDPLN